MLLVAPAPSLRPFIQHYWLSRDNLAPLHRILPDGAVDVVVQWQGSSSFTQVYGTTTTPVELGLPTHWHFLGIRIQPGQSRHFLLACARELTDQCHASAGLLAFPLPLEALLSSSDPFEFLDQALLQHLQHRPPVTRREDRLITALVQQRGQVPIATLAEQGARSQRQLERDFLSSVGISAKLFARIQRFHHACFWLQPSYGVPLAEVALRCGYSDQSHMNRDFNALAGCTPQQWRLQQDVDFFQEAGTHALHTARHN